VVRKIAAGLIALLLAGCAGAGSYGVTAVDMRFENGQLVEAHWTDGKEKKDVAVAVKTPAGSFEYRASDVSAFEGQKIAAELHKALAAAGVDVAESLVTGAVAAALGPAALGGLTQLGGAAILAP
jgi:hypothetical protein